MPYALAINSSGTNVCGENSVNSGAPGKLDGFSIVLGHEIEETITDPGAEDIISTGLTGTQTYYGGWYDAADANENGDKCAWVGENLLTAQGPPEPIYGALGDITGNTGTRFAVQALWSNAADEGTGYCAGAGTDSPIPSAAYGSSSTSTTGAPTPSGSGTSTSSAAASTVSTVHTATKRKKHRASRPKKHASRRRKRTSKRRP
jgi:serine protease